MVFKNAENTAQEFNNNITENEKIKLYKNQWSRKEKYVLLWAIEYSQKKIIKVNKERTRVFSEFFFSQDANANKNLTPRKEV